MIFNNIQTPFYVLDEAKLLSNISVLIGAINKYWKNTIIGYSFKTNSLKRVCEIMKENNIYAEVVSVDEYRLAKELNFDNKIIYNGMLKTKESFIEAVDSNSIVNIDSFRELEWILDAKVKKIGVRVNIDMEKYCPGETVTKDNGGRFGFCYENGELSKVIDFLNKNNIEICGLHLHCSSKTRSTNIYKVICEKSVEIINEYKLNLEYLDIGGGFFGGVVGKTNFYDYFKIIANIIKPFKDITLIVEPGASLIATAIDYYSSVIDVKATTYGNFVVTDGSRIHLDPLFSKSTYDYDIIYQTITKEKKDYCISGFTCVENDRLMNICANELSNGDIIKYKNVGSYTMCLSPLFIGYFPEVWSISVDGEYCLIRKKWTIKNYLQGQ